ncbi:MAG: alpha/beta hydrolase [Anaerolineae bacterium]|nr:alpha/beta hydrolase [Anaerolineae bacterium]
MRRPRNSPETVLHIRGYGSTGPDVIVLHGGPGAAGYMAPVARGLAAPFRVLEPFQRGSGGEPLTVARHVADLHEVVTSCAGEVPPALVGHSWGAMLALCYAAAHPGSVTSLALIGCGTFDPASRQRMRAIRQARMTDPVRARVERLAEQYPDPDERLCAQARLVLPLDSYELEYTDAEPATCDARAHEETWQDMMRLQEAGVYPAAFTAIDAPVLMLHGAVDPHPGHMIEASLRAYLPQLEYREWECCGHYPWLEKAVRAEFFTVLRDWLARQIEL